MAERALVVGCGVSGLTSAIALAEAGFQVTIWTRDLPPRTTSNVAGAIWYPYKVEPLERVAEWARRRKIPHLFALAGGYKWGGLNLEQIAELHLETVQAFAQP
jgi:D-amino-acid oxidase